MVVVLLLCSGRALDGHSTAMAAYNLPWPQTSSLALSLRQTGASQSTLACGHFLPSVSSVRFGKATTASGRVIADGQWGEWKVRASARRSTASAQRQQQRGIHVRHTRRDAARVVGEQCCQLATPRYHREPVARNRRMFASARLQSAAHTKQQRDVVGLFKKALQS